MTVPRETAAVAGGLAVTTAPTRRAKPIRPWRLLAFSLTALGAVTALFAGLLSTWQYAGWDVYAYWAVDASDPYRSHVAPDAGAFLYAPVIAQIMDPLGALDFWPLRVAWTGAQSLALVVLTGPLVGPLAVAFPPVTEELRVGNVSLFMALAIVAGFRWPALWAFPILTKVTPVVGLVWFAVRREWRNLAIAVGTTAGLVAVSFVATPHLWWQWVDVLRDNTAIGGDLDYAPLWVRWPLAAGIVAWGARGHRRWVVPIAVAISFGHMWPSVLSVGVGALYYARRNTCSLAISSRWQRWSPSR